jgi:hypothetical protein
MTSNQYYRTGGQFLAWSPIDDDNVVEVYNAYDTSTHTYFAARTASSYTATGGVVTLTCTQNPTGFSMGTSGDIVVVSTGNSEVDGEFTITATSGATITYSQPFVATTSSPVSLTGTVDWKNKKVTQITGMRGDHHFTQGTLANAPQWDNTNKRMIFLNTGRQYFLNFPSGLRDDISGVDVSIIGVMQANGSALRYIVGSSGTTTFAMWNSGGTPNQLNVTLGGTILQYTDASNNNGNIKLIGSVATNTNRALYVNDMDTAKNSNANNGRISWSTVQGYIARNGTFYSINYVNLIVFAKTALDANYRNRLKAWVKHSYGVNFA